MKYRLRIDEVNGVTADNVKVVLHDADSIVVVRHILPHGNPHYHAYFELDAKDNTIRQRFKRKFEELKSTDMSLKKCDEDKVNEYVQYLFNRKHDNRPELCYTHNFDLELLDDLKKRAEDVATDYAESRKSTVKSKGPTIWDIAQMVEQRFKEQYHTVDNLGDEIHNYYSNEERKVEVYTDLAIEVLRQNKKAFDEFLLRKVISTAMSSTEKGKTILRKKMIKTFCGY